MSRISFLKKVYNKDYWVLIGIGFLPLIWKVLQIVFLIGFVDALKILGQISLISIIFKIFEETLLNPIYKILSKENCKNIHQRNTIIRKFLIVFSLLTILFTILIFFCARPIMTISKVPAHIFDKTFDFIRIYIWSCGLGVISKYLFTIAYIDKKSNKIYWYFIIKAFATALLFLIFVPKFTCGLGVVGIAIVEGIVNISTIAYLLIGFARTESPILTLDKKEYCKLVIFAFIETLIRNIVYYFVILVFLNMLDNQDLYFVANEYIWAIMLVPTLAQNELIKQDISNNPSISLKPYFQNTLLLLSFMLVLIPLSLVLFKYVYALDNFMDYFWVLIKLFPCYILFIFDAVIESYFIATGKLNHILIQSLLTNVVVYMTALILYLCGLWTITLNSIILLFNLGVVVSSIYTITVYLIQKRKEKLIEK